MSLGISGGVIVSQKKQSNGGISNGARSGLTVVGGYVELGNIGVGNPLLHNTYINTDGYLFQVGDLDSTHNATNLILDDSLKVFKITSNSGIRLKIDQANKLYEIGDISAADNGTYLQVDDDSLAVRVNSGAARWVELSPNQQAIGDILNQSTGITIICDNNNGALLFKKNGEAGANFLQFDPNNFFYEFGDLSNGHNSQQLRLDDSGNQLLYWNGAVNYMKVTPSEFTVQVSGGVLIKTTTALTNGAGAAAGTLLNAPAAGNPTKWIPIVDNGTTRHIPAW